MRAEAGMKRRYSVAASVRLRLLRFSNVEQSIVPVERPSGRRLTPAATEGIPQVVVKRAGWGQGKFRASFAPES